MQPRVIDRKYEIVRELSRGGMGAIYEARHLLTRRKVALKLMLADRLVRGAASDALRRFEREARAAGSIESRHVVSVLDTGVESSTNEPYIVMELLDGEDLRTLLRRHGRLEPELVLAVASQVCQGLRRAHERGVVHRDIKAANIFLARRDGGEVEVKVLDFGIAKLRVDPLASTDGNELTRSGSVLGSPLYMSPEQATGSREIDARSDIWSLGVVMYEALSGAPPHGQQALGAVILAICSQPAEPLRRRAPWVSEQVARVVHQALALEPSQRYASAEQMREAIDACLPNGATIHESVLDALPKAPDEQAASDGPHIVSSSPPAITQTTATAVTYGSVGAGRSTAGRARPVGRALALLAGVSILGASAALWRNDAARPPADAALSSASIGATAASTESPNTGSKMSSAPPASSLFAVPNTLPELPKATPSKPTSTVGTPRARPRPVAPPTPPAPSLVVTPSAPAAAPQVEPPAPVMPGIDRHFD